jgi:hypothetical protein
VLTVLGAGPLAALIVYQIVKRDPARHYWIVVLSTAELYGGYVFLFQFFGREQNCVTNSRVPDDDVGGAGGGDDDWMTFCPEWLTGSPSLDTSNVLFFWVYLVVSFFLRLFDVTRINLFFSVLQFMNIMYVILLYFLRGADCGRLSSWVLIPLWLMYDSYTHIAGSLRSAQAGKARKVE